MIMVLAGLILIYVSRERINQLSLITKRRIVVGFSLLLLANMIILYVSSFYYQTFDYKTMLPFHLCYLANYFYRLNYNGQKVSKKKRIYLLLKDIFHREIISEDFVNHFYKFDFLFLIIKSNLEALDI